MDEALPEAPARPPEGHKGTFGTVVVFGGSPAMIGAPALAARAALRGGAGRVRCAAAAPVLTPLLTIEPSATGLPLTGRDVPADRARLAALDPRSVLVVGPGLGTGRWARALVEAVLAGPWRIVLDADGLNALAATGRPRPAGPKAPAALVMTPHPGEYRRLAGSLGLAGDPVSPAGRGEAARALAGAHRSVVLLKGRHSVVSDGAGTWVNRTGNPALATAGSGDVLAGLIAALLAQGMGPVAAARLGAHVHGAAADAWAEAHGPSGMRAMDLADRLPAALHAVS